MKSFLETPEIPLETGVLALVTITPRAIMQSKSPNAISPNETDSTVYDPVPFDAETGMEQTLEVKTKAVSRRGRYHSFKRPPTSPNLFPEGKTIHRMASNRLIWESCNILTHGEKLGWISDGDDSPRYESMVAKGRGFISYWVTSDFYSKHPAVLEGEAAIALIEQFDIRAACMHLIYAAHATQLERPWEQSFVLSDAQLERYLGLDQNRKLTKQQKLQLMLDLAKQPCHLLVYVSYPDQGKVKGFTVSRTWLWEIAEPLLHFQECLQNSSGDSMGEKQLVGFTLKVRCGSWAEYFLNKDKIQDKSGYYEYGILSQGLLRDLMSTWHHNEGAARLMTWLLFKTKVNRNSPLIVETLLKVAFGEEDVQVAKDSSKERKRIIRMWLTSIKVLMERGWTLQPDPETYPEQYWVEVPNEQVPDDPDEALEFWTTAAKVNTEVPKRRLRGSFEQLLNGRLFIQPPQEIAEKLDAIAEYRLLSAKDAPKKLTAASGSTSDKLARAELAQKTTKATAKPERIESGEQLRQFRLHQGWSQKELAEYMNRSVSWVKMVEGGQRNIQPEDIQKLQAFTRDEQLQNL